MVAFSHAQLQLAQLIGQRGKEKKNSANLQINKNSLQAIAKICRNHEVIRSVRISAMLPASRLSSASDRFRRPRAGRPWGVEILSIAF